MEETVLNELRFKINQTRNNIIEAVTNQQKSKAKREEKLISSILMLAFGIINKKRAELTIENAFEWGKSHNISNELLLKDNIFRTNDNNYPNKKKSSYRMNKYGLEMRLEYPIEERQLIFDPEIIEVVKEELKENNISFDYKISLENKTISINIKCLNNYYEEKEGKLSSYFKSYTNKLEKQLQAASTNEAQTKKFSKKIKNYIYDLINSPLIEANKLLKVSDYEKMKQYLGQEQTIDFEKINAYVFLPNEITLFDINRKELFILNEDNLHIEIPIYCYLASPVTKKIVDDVIKDLKEENIIIEYTETKEGYYYLTIDYNYTKEKRIEERFYRDFEVFNTFYNLVEENYNKKLQAEKDKLTISIVNLVNNIMRDLNRKIENNEINYYTGYEKEENHQELLKLLANYKPQVSKYNSPYDIEKSYYYYNINTGEIEINILYPLNQALELQKIIDEELKNIIETIGISLKFNIRYSLENIKCGAYGGELIISYNYLQKEKETEIKHSPVLTYGDKYIKTESKK